ncbi:alkane 1-monooxygenase [Thalassobius sp. I31.1]|uniref:alkane 1-monooxygenase n=1 Tax=Thalassobius sp. I31.1 TaxID=2109912 RepID=UPI000D1A2854|nr:alkane 1-monooxygenase [Thalassobius sp. I31.1]
MLFTKFSRRFPIACYGLVISLPIILLLLAMMFGGLWAALAFLSVALLTTVMDEILPAHFTKSESPEVLDAADNLSMVLAGVHFLLLLLGVRALSMSPELGFWSTLFLFAALGHFFGQVSNSNAHELIHRSDKLLFSLGKCVYISLLFGHHTSAHVLVHHRYVATPQDPNSARLGESFWQFFPRAWKGAFLAGLNVESARLRHRDGKVNPIIHPYTQYLGGAVLMLLLALLTGGLNGVIVLLALSTFAQVQLMLSDYVQHYGLQRTPMENGRYEPCGPMHSWNSPHFYSSHLMLNAPRHSDHHKNPMRSWPSLEITPGLMPVLPRSLPTMATLALFPRRWFKVMDHRVAALSSRQKTRRSGSPEI